MADTGTVLMAGSAAVGVIVWLVRLEGRVNIGEKVYERVEKDIKEIKDDVKELLRK